MPRLLLLALLFLGFGLQAQLELPPVQQTSFTPIGRPTFFRVAPPRIEVSQVVDTQTTRPTLPQVFRAEDLALFCKIEFKIEQKTKMPVRFRLGSVDYVDYLEGKRDYKLPPSKH